MLAQSHDQIARDVACWCAPRRATTRHYSHSHSKIRDLTTSQNS